MKTRELIKKRRPFVINGVSFCFSTFANQWVSCKLSNLPKIEATGERIYLKESNYSFPKFNTCKRSFKNSSL